jgi:hypothetical protein
MYLNLAYHQPLLCRTFPKPLESWPHGEAEGAVETVAPHAALALPAE